MAHQATTWAYQLPIRNVTQKFILVALADMADEAFTCFPGQDKLADMTGAGVRSVQRALSELEALGLIRREERRRSDGYRTSDRYFLNVGAELKSHPPQSQVTNCQVTNETTSPANLTDLTRHSGGYIEEELPVELPEESPDSSSGIADTLPRRDDVEVLLDLLDAEIARNGSKVPMRNKRNRDAMRLLIDRDGHTPQQVAAAIRWSQQNTFWMSNILSAVKLRERYDQLRLQAGRERSGSNKALQRQAENLAVVERAAALDAAEQMGITA